MCQVVTAQPNTLSQEPLGYGIKGWEDIKKGSQILKQDFRNLTGTNLKIAFHKTVKLLNQKWVILSKLQKNFTFLIDKAFPRYT